MKMNIRSKPSISASILRKNFMLLFMLLNACTFFRDCYRVVGIYIILIYDLCLSY